MAYGCQWESCFADHRATDATHDPIGCGRMRLSKTALFKKSNKQITIRSDDRTGVWPWKACSRSSHFMRVSRSTKGLGHRRSLTIWRTKTCEKNLACHFRISSLVYATNDCLPRHEHFADQVPMNENLGLDGTAIYAMAPLRKPAPINQLPKGLSIFCLK